MAFNPSNLNKPTPNMTWLDKAGKLTKDAAAWFGALGAVASWAVTGALSAATAVFSTSMAAPVAGILGSNPLLHVQEEQPSGTNAGTFTSGAWRTRNLNAVRTNSIPGASLAASQVTLPAGTYWAEWTAPAHSVDQHATRLWNITTGAEIAPGSGENTQQTQGGVQLFVQTRSLGAALFTIAGATVIELQHRCRSTEANDGLGTGVGGFWAVSKEVYSILKIWKLA